MNTSVQIMDTTLRDGEQTTGVSFTEAEKLNISQFLLKEVKVDRLEVASARVSNGEFEAVKRIIGWAIKENMIDRIEILGFVDGTQSVEWIEKSGAKVMNLLCKGSLKHVEGQLRKTPEEHLNDIKKVVSYAQSKGISCNIYLEDWSNGMRNSKDYVFFLLDGLQNEPINRFMLPDTLGILSPHETYEHFYEIKKRYPNLHYDFHAHNDYDLAVANVIEAVKAGADCIHTTVNGLGERAGNAPLSSVIAVLKDQLNCKISVDEKKLNSISKLVESFSGVRIPANKPLIGEFVFTQCSGVHADGDSKDKLYRNNLDPERFGRKISYALGKTSGKSNIKKNLDELGLKLDEESLKRVTERVIKLGDLKKTVTMDDLPYIVSDVLDSQSIQQKIKIVSYVISLSKELHPTATIKIEVNNEEYEATSEGDGQYDAFMNALKKIYLNLNKPFPRLLDYSVSIPPGGKTDALVETIITWKMQREFKTRGLKTDQTSAAIVATEKMLNIIENH